MNIFHIIHNIFTIPEKMTKTSSVPLCLRVKNSPAREIGIPFAREKLEKHEKMLK